MDNIAENLLSVFQYDPVTKDLRIQDPADEDRTFVIKLDGKSRIDNDLDINYLKYYLLGLREKSRVIKDKMRLYSEEGVKKYGHLYPPEVRQSVKLFKEFRDALILTLKSSGLNFGKVDDGVLELKKSIDYLLNSKKGLIKSKLNELVRNEEIKGNDFLIKVKKSLVDINKSIDLPALLGIKNNERHYLGIFNIIQSRRLRGYTERILKDPKDFVNSYIRHVLGLIESVCEDEELKERVILRGDITYSQFIKSVTTELAASSLEAYKYFVKGLEGMEETLKKKPAELGNIDYARSLRSNKENILLLVLISKFGLQASPKPQIHFEEEYKNIFIKKGTKSELDFGKILSVRPERLKNFMNRITVVYANRQAALYTDEKGSINLTNYDTLHGISSEWIVNILKVLIYLVSNPDSLNKGKLKDREDKIHAIADFLKAAYKDDNALLETYSGLLSNQEYIRNLRIKDEIDRVKSFKEIVERKSVKSICGFEPTSIFKENNLLTFRKWILETELFALVNSMYSKKSVDAKHLYSTLWQQDLYKSRFKQYGSLTREAQKDLFNQKIGALQKLLGKDFDVKDYMQKYNRVDFLNNFVKEIMDTSKPANMARNIDLLTRLSRMSFDWQDIYSSGEDSHLAFNRFQVFIKRLSDTLRDSSGKEFPSLQLHEIFSDGATFDYFLKFLKKSFSLTGGFNTAPELGAVLYYLALKTLQTPSRKENFLSDSYGYRRNLFSIFFNSKFLTKLKQLSPSLYEKILDMHSKQVNNYVNDLERFTGEMIERTLDDPDRFIAATDDEAHSDLENLLVKYYYPLEQTIAQFPEGKYKIAGIRKFIDKVIDIDPNIILEMYKLQGTPEVKKILIKSLLKKTSGLAREISRISNFAENGESFETFLDNLRVKLEHPYEGEHSKQIDFMASSHNLKSGTLRYIFSKFYNAHPKYGLYVRLAYSLVEDRSSLSSFKKLISNISKNKTDISNGHILFGDDQLRTSEGRAGARALIKFYKCVNALNALTPVDRDNESLLLENGFKSSEISNAKLEFSAIRNILNLKHIFYQSPSDEFKADPAEDISINEFSKWKNKLMKEFKEIAPIRDSIRALSTKNKTTNTNVQSTKAYDYVEANWLKLARKHGDKERVGLLDFPSISGEKPKIIEAIDNLVSKRLDHHVSYSRRYLNAA